MDFCTYVWVCSMLLKCLKSQEREVHRAKMEAGHKKCMSGRWALPWKVGASDGEEIVPVLFNPFNPKCKIQKSYAPGPTYLLPLAAFQEKGIPSKT